MFNPALFDFLRDLRENNKREWYQEHKDTYKALRAEFTEEVETIVEAIAAFDPLLAAQREEWEVLKVFRLYRDTRFSKDKTPYKTNISAVIGGDNAPSYYLSLEPDGSMAGGGIYMPPKAFLKGIREAIDEDPEALRALLEAPAFVEVFPEGLSTMGALKTAPRGYPVTHTAIHLLRLKHFVATQRFDDDEVFQDDFRERLLKIYRALQPINAYLLEIQAAVEAEAG